MEKAYLNKYLLFLKLYYVNTIVVPEKILVHNNMSFNILGKILLEK